MKRVGKCAVLGLAVAATVSIPRLAEAPVATASPAAWAEAFCTGEEDVHARDEHEQARVRYGARVIEPGSRTSAKVAEQVERELDRQRIAGRLLRVADDGKWINIPVNFHVLHNGGKGKVAKKALLEQIKVLDAAYRGRKGGYNAKINFYLKKVTWTENADWFRNPRLHEADFKKELRKGGDSTLNVYTADLGSELLGWATMPWDYKKDPARDGVIIHHSSLPGGKIKHYSLGYTAVHEVGHWLGLYHTFGRDPGKDGCKVGDLVGDTPAQKQPTNGCPKKAGDSCPSAWGRDSIHNFMDYGYDKCMTEFTKGQAERMRTAWKRYRA
ncbi:zinc metalloprotease [Actinocorallia sp. B10E7]|uniref:zinc metalloprotease n=1 Tax=Actinocorallia sp. B10E7 TaxID=3153558 RepID=UPI00325C5F3C